MYEIGLFNRVIENLIDKNTTNIQEEGDYIGENGLLFCGKCHTAKQVEINFNGIIKRPKCLCKCRKEKIAQEEAERKRVDAQIRIQKLKMEGITDEAYLKWTISNDDRKNLKLSNAVIRYCEKWDEIKANNTGIIFYGNVGTGKSFYAACIANELIEQGVPVLMTNVTLLISSMSKNFEERKTSILNQVANIPLLILDDIGVERDTAYGYEKLQEIIDTRYRSGKPLIVTTNLSQSELQNPTDIRYKRVYDRLLEMCHLILVDGESRRRSKSFEKRKKAIDILGI